MAWLYVPGMDSRCAPDMVDSNSECALRSEAVTELLVSSRGTLLRPASLQRGWQKGRWSRLLSGMTLPPSTAQAGVDAWILSLAEYRASPSPSPASGKGSMMSGGYGLTLRESLARWDRATCSWRTFPDLFGMDSVMSSDRWPKWGSMRNGVVSAQPKWAPPTSESAFSFWPTATVNGNHNRKGLTATSGDGRATAARQWPTPTVNDSRNDGPPSQRARNTPPLNAAASLWQTPTVGGGGQQCELIPHRGHFRRPSGAKATLYLEQQADMWATPRASPQENRATRVYGTNTGIEHSEGLAQQVGSFHPDRGIVRDGTPISNTRRRLNPRFVSRLMGIPDGWTSCSCSVMESYPSWLHTHSWYLHNVLAPKRRDD